jgi:Bax protein
MKVKNFEFQQIKNYLKKKGFTISRIKKNNFLNKDFNSIYATILSSLLIGIFFYIFPIYSDYKKNVNLNSKEVKNKSKSNFEKVLEGKNLEKENPTLDQGLDVTNLLEDIFQFDELPSDTVRLSATTLEQLFKDTNYNLKDVRETKLVKPINLSLLPEKMKMIENTKKRKKLFIKIILPLILEENNRIRIDRKKFFTILNKNKNTKSEKKWIEKKFKQYGVVNKDFSTLKVRMDEIPVSLIIAQAAKETGWGTSRFAIEGNALFGQWTYTGEGIKPANSESESTHKVMKFKILQASVRAYQRNLNTHSSYKKFRLARAELRDKNKNLNSIILADFLDKYAETGLEYVRILKQIISQNNLTDFDDAQLLPTSISLKSLI